MVGQWLADIDARLDEIILSGWWDRPLVFLLMLLLAAVVCGMPLLVAGGYAVGWPAWWILLTVAAHLIYLAKLAGPISRFIRNS